MNSFGVDPIKYGGDHGAANYDLLWIGTLPGTYSISYHCYYSKNIDNKCIAKQTIRDNMQRLNILNFEKTECDFVKVTFHSTHGHQDIEVFEIRTY